MVAEPVTARLDWAGIEARLDQDGYAILPGLLTADQVRELARLPTMLPPWVAGLGAGFSRRLASIANRWSDALGSDHRHPDQTRPQSNLALLREGGYQELRHCAGAELVVAFQLTALLSEPGTEFTGGELVMVEQRPRMQSRPMVLPLDKADAAIFATAHRPHKGSRGYYRTTLRHAVSRVRSGERLALDLVFH
jgi:hypothetical protein